MGARRTAHRLLAGLTVLALASATAGPPAGADGPAPGSLGPGPTPAYIAATFQLFLGRAATDAELSRWSTPVHHDRRDALTTTLASSDEWAGARVDELYRDALGRAADEQGRAHWVARIAAGLRLEDVAAFVYGSEEYWRRVGAEHGSFVDSLYRALLGREPDADGRAHWVAQLRSGTLGRIGVAAHFFGSLESRRDRVRARYDEVLGRLPDPGGLDHWTERLARLGDVSLDAQLAASVEFHHRATGVRPATARLAPVGPGTAYPLQASWRAGCPVGPGDLVAVEFSHWDDDGAVRAGVLVVHRTVARDIAFVVRTMYGTAFPLTSARPVDDFGGDDDRSMAADNSSAFNCRTVAGTTSWSRHAYGTAVDLNPVRNPYVRGDQVEPPAGAAWLDRSDVRPGMLVEGGSVVAAFDAIGWGWGGRWTSAQDHQHFSSDGR